ADRRRLVGVQGLQGRGVERLQPVVDEAKEQRFLVVVIAVDGREAHARLAGDRAHVDPMKILAREHAQDDRTEPVGNLLRDFRRLGFHRRGRRGGRYQGRARTLPWWARSARLRSSSWHGCSALSGADGKEKQRSVTTLHCLHSTTNDDRALGPGGPPPAPIRSGGR